MIQSAGLFRVLSLRSNEMCVDLFRLCFQIKIQFLIFTRMLLRNGENQTSYLF